MDEENDWQQWFRLADLDLSVAEHLAISMHPTPDEPICFHCQQAAEKYLKGYLVFNGIEPPQTHVLFVLLKMCKEILHSFSKLQQYCVFLNKFGVLPRYPNDLEITDGDIKLVLSYAKKIKEFVYWAISFES